MQLKSTALMIAAMPAFIAACAERPTSNQGSQTLSSSASAAMLNDATPLLSASKAPPSVPAPSAMHNEPAKKPTGPIMKAMKVFLTARGDDAEGATSAYFLFVKDQRMNSVPADEIVYTALTLNTDQGTGAGSWWLYAIKGQTVTSLGTLESLNEDCVRLFRTKQGVTVFRRFWRQLIDPTPEQAHTGTFEDVKLTPKGLQRQAESAKVDFETKKGAAIWDMGKADKYRCDVEVFRTTGSCELEKEEDDD